MSSKFFHGGSFLSGNNTVPGVKLTPELKEYIPVVLKACKDYGLDFYPTVVQLLKYDEISEIAAYNGFPVRYPHWKWGMEYEELQRGYEHGRFKIFEMVINCVDPKTMIPTSCGSIPAELVQAGDTVYSRNGSRSVAKVVKQKSSSTLKIKLKHQVNELNCTPNHKWFVMTNEGPSWVKAENIKSGDTLIGGDTYRYYQNNPAKFEWDFNSVLEKTSLNVRHRLKFLAHPKEMTIALAELLGVIVGDGSQGVASRENAISVCVDKKEVDYISHVKNLFKIALNQDALIESKEMSVDVITLCSKAAVDFIDYIGLPKGCTYKTKKIPWSIWASSNEFRAAFIRGLFDTDGCAKDALSMSCYNFDLVSDVQLLLSEMGIYSKVNRIDNDNNHIWVLSIVGKEALCKYKDRIGFFIQRKSESLSKLIDTENCVGGGIKNAWLQAEIIKIAEKCGITVRSEPHLGRTILNLKKNPVGLNALYGCVLRAWTAGYSEFAEIYQWLSNPLFEVENVTDNGEMETVDIALFDDSHDFMANGVVSHNTNPCMIWCLASNTLLDHLTVVAHATGHNDFFKNNIHFGATDRNMLNKMANNATRIRRYSSRWGQEKVMEFIDHVMRLETLIDPARAWDEKQAKDSNIIDKREYHQPVRLRIDPQRSYMDSFINTKEFKAKQNEKVKREEIADEIGLFQEPTRDILGFIRDNAPLKPWQADIIAMMHEESLYFYPQRQTKVGNEGWASFIDHVIMSRQGLASLGRFDSDGKSNQDGGIINYATHKMQVLGGKYSTNPYKLGFSLLLDIEDRWNKGRFGPEWEACTDINLRKNWDKKLNLGKEKLFEVRKLHDDVNLISEFFTEEFCRENEYFNYKYYPNGEAKVEPYDYKKIKSGLIKKHLNGGLPSIHLTEPNYRGRGYMMLQHDYDGRILNEPFAKEVMTSIRYLWNNDVYLASADKAGQEIIYGCYGSDVDDIDLMTTKQHTKELHFGKKEQ